MIHFLKEVYILVKCLKSIRPYNTLYIILFLRSTLDITHLNVPRANTVLGQKAFSVAGPIIWNSLPPVIRESVSLSLFRKVLKTHLYPC